MRIRPSAAAYVDMRSTSPYFHVHGDGVGIVRTCFHAGTRLSRAAIVCGRRARSADESVASITPVQVSAISKSELFRIIDEMPRVGTALLWALSCEEAVVADHVVSLGRRDALERISRFLLELRERLQVVGLASERGYSCPLVQHDLADTLGLTVVHVNRILRRLRENELLTLSRGHLRIHDLGRLTELAKFTGRYLDHAREQSVQ